MTAIQLAILRYLRRAETDVHGIAAGLGISLEDATAALVGLEASGQAMLRTHNEHGRTPRRWWVATGACPVDQEQG